MNYDIKLAAKFEIISDETLDLVVKTFKENATTGEVADGYIMVSDLDEFIEITNMDEAK